MNQVNCPVCGMKCVKSGKTKAGSQRWLCKNCKTSLTHKINNESKELQIFLDWLFGKESQSTMSGEGRSFRRKTAKFWDIWAMPPKIAESRDVVFLDGIYLGRKACVLICCDEKHVLGWYLCRYEHAGAWIALMKRIAEPRMVVSDGRADGKRLTDGEGQEQTAQQSASQGSHHDDKWKSKHPQSDFSKMVDDSALEAHVKTDKEQQNTETDGNQIAGQRGEKFHIGKNPVHSEIAESQSCDDAYQDDDGHRAVLLSLFLLFCDFFRRYFASLYVPVLVQLEELSRDGDGCH